jgi:uncharacterized membrane protein
VNLGTPCTRETCAYDVVPVALGAGVAVAVVLLSSFGVFFLAEGLHVEWPGGDAAVLYLVAVFAAVSQLQSHRLARA